VAQRKPGSRVQTWSEVPSSLGPAVLGRTLTVKRARTRARTYTQDVARPCSVLSVRNRPLVRGGPMRPCASCMCTLKLRAAHGPCGLATPTPVKRSVRHNTLPAPLPPPAYPSTPHTSKAHPPTHHKLTIQPASPKLPPGSTEECPREKRCPFRFTRCASSLAAAEPRFYIFRIIARNNSSSVPYSISS
jgi:hypothetical protein